MPQMVAKTASDEAGPPENARGRTRKDGGRSRKVARKVAQKNKNHITNDARETSGRRQEMKIIDFLLF